MEFSPYVMTNLRLPTKLTGHEKGPKMTATKIGIKTSKLSERFPETMT